MELDITGARILWETPINVPVLGQLKISETMVISWLVMLLITGACIWLTRDLKEENISKRQALAELIVEKANQFVVGNMGERFRYFVPFVAALFATSVLSNLISLIGLRSPTADLSTEAAWAVVVFIMITAQKIKTNGFGGYLKGFTTPIAVMTPFNILSELATPVSMACRHFGNILSGVVINALIYGALAVASSALFGLIPGVVGDVLSKIPFLDVGIPAILSVYFRLVLRLYAGIYLLYADSHVYCKRCGRRLKVTAQDDQKIYYSKEDFYYGISDARKRYRISWLCNRCRLLPDRRYRTWYW